MRASLFAFQDVGIHYCEGGTLATKKWSPLKHHVASDNERVLLRSTEAKQELCRSPEGVLIVRYKFLDATGGEFVRDVEASPWQVQI